MARSARWIALVVLGGLAGLAAGCGTTTRVNNCGPAYTFSFHQFVSEGCGGVIPTKPPAVTVHRGETFSVQITSEQSGALDFPLPQPTGPAVQLLSLDHGTATYRAVQTGRALLVAYHTQFCFRIDPKVGNCAALAVRVIP
jgi:hypothetical protein